MPQTGDNLWPVVDDDDLPPIVPAEPEEPPAVESEEEPPVAEPEPAPPAEPEPVAEPEPEPEPVDEPEPVAEPVAEATVSLGAEPTVALPPPQPPEPVEPPTLFLPVPAPAPAPPPAPVPVPVPMRESGSLRGQIAAPWPPPEPPRAAPERIGPEPPPRPEEPDEPHGNRRKVALIVVAALILVAGAGTGAVFAVPGLKSKLGLGDSEPEVVIQPPPAPVSFAPALRAPGNTTPAPTPAGVAAAIGPQLSAPGLGQLTGTVLDAATGETLWAQGASTPLVPASTGKLLTAAAALLSVSHTEQLSTKVVAGKDPGTAIIVGGGDVTLSSLKAGVDSVYPGAAHLSELVDQVKAKNAGIRTVYVDVSRFAGNAMEASWDPADVAAGHIAPIMPVMLDGGRADATKATTPRSATPAKATADEFAGRIGAKVAAEVTTTAVPGATVLGEVRSAPMVELVDNLLQRSDNVLAEAVGHEVAKANGEEVSFAGASRATVKVLQQNGFDVSGLSLADASGLSGQDKVPAKLLAQILAVAAGPDGKDPRTAKLRPLLGGLPVAGGGGTLQDRYNTPGSGIGRGWVRAKTGTLSVPPVNSLAGVVLDNDGRLLVFALMTNGSQSGPARPALDAIAATLRKCGCY